MLYQKNGVIKPYDSTFKMLTDCNFKTRVSTLPKSFSNFNIFRSIFLESSKPNFIAETTKYNDNFKTASEEFGTTARCSRVAVMKNGNSNANQAALF